jgi:beta-lactamase superfamily II metal-dependent hydrolase
MAASDVPVGRLDKASPGSLAAAMTATTLVYITLNVGDGDCQLLLLPADARGQRKLVIVDVVRAAKLLALIDDLEHAGVLGPDGAQLDVIVATHPHADHIRGIPTVLDALVASRPEVWEPGYRHVSGMYLDILDRIAQYGLDRTVVTAGMTRYIAQTRITVLAPAVSLQRRFDSYGVNINNSSVCLKVDYPATRVVREATDMGVTHSFIDDSIGQTLILGADAQMLSWSHVLMDFPQLGPQPSAVSEALRIAGGTQPLNASVFKVPHHGSKHGLTLELVEAITPKVSIVSSVHSGGQFYFPHDVAIAQLREGVNAIATKPATKHQPDEDLAVLFTGSTVESTADPVGSVCVICQVGGQREIWRMMDAAASNIDLDDARRMN